MQLNCVSNSLKIKIGKSELKRLNNVGVITETIRFGGQTQLSYGIAIDSKHKEGCVIFENNLVAIHVPIKIAENWINSNEIGIEFYDSTGDGNLLHILIEKDFNSQPATRKI